MTARRAATSQASADTGNASAPLDGHAGPAGPPRRLDALDGYRALAALGVVVSHVAGATGVTGTGLPWSVALGNLGNASVSVFFVLSGFLLYRPFIAAHFDDRPAPSARTYLRHRLLRIFPAFLLASVGYVVLVGPRFEATVGNYLTAVTLTVPYRQGDYFRNAMLGVDWTLTVELAFYLLLPFVAGAIGTVARRRASPAGKLRVELGALLVLVGVSFLYRAVLADLIGRTGVPATLWVFNYLDWFSLGMGFAVFWAWRARGGRVPAPLVALASNWGMCWLLAGCAYAMVSVVRFRATDGRQFAVEPTTLTLVRFALNGMVALLLVLPAVLGSTDGRLHRMLCLRWVAWLGTVSYGIYLWHMVFLRWLEGRLPDITFWPALAGVLLLTVPTAAASWYLLERPLLRWRGSSHVAVSSSPVQEQR